MLSATHVFEGDLNPAQEKGYVYLPFDVPSGVGRVEVAYEYSHRIDSDPLLSGGNTIDLGVFDARGIDFLSAGFRGWSGSERATFFITKAEATPGYLEGALPQGRWHVLLGLYKIAPEGCHYSVTVKVAGDDAELHAERTPDANDLPASAVKHRHGRWLRGEMHCHTIHSDGDSDPREVVRLAAERGLDFLAITDHNSLSCQRVLEQVRDPGLVLIRGIEVTTFKGHFNVWGIPDWVDFRVTCPEEMEAAVRFAVEHGGLVSCNHPKPFGPLWDYPQVEGTHCIEVWNGPWQENNSSSLKFWTDKLAQGKHFVAVGGSDWHNHQELQESPPRAPGTPTVWVYVPGAPTADGILDAIGRGHVALSAEPNGALVEFSMCPAEAADSDGALYDLCVEPERAARGGDTLPRAREMLMQVRCHGGAGQTLSVLDQKGVSWTRRVSQDDETCTARVSTAESLYVRAELRNDRGEMHALTNPIYLEVPE